MYEFTYVLTDTTATFIHSEPKSTLITAKQFTDEIEKINDINSTRPNLIYPMLAILRRTMMDPAKQGSE